MNPGGDIITAVDGRPLNDAAAVAVALLRLTPGQEVVLRVYRVGRPRDVKLELGRGPTQADAGVVP